jgi:ribose 5-phosphate isomerase RpiB
MNLLCLGGRGVGFGVVLEIIQVYLAVQYEKTDRFESVWQK